MSFADGLKSLKGLMSSSGGDKAGEARRRDEQRAEEERRERRKSDFQRRLWEAGKSVRSKVRPLPREDVVVEEERGIGVLLLIIDGLPYEELWREWARRQDGKTQVRFWIHAKYPDRITSSWVKRRLLPRSFRPEWGSVDITRAELELLRCALGETSSSSAGGGGGLPVVQRFILASETCLPIVPLARFVHAAFDADGGGDKSWVNARSTPNNGYSTQKQFDPLEYAWVPREAIWKADQWCLLTRHHGESILELPKALGEDLWPLFKKVTASDEMYIPTCLAILGEITTTTTDDHGPSSSSSILRRRMTFCHWGESPKSPVTFTSSCPLPPDLLAQARGEGCLLARKFAPGAVTWQAWVDMMREAEGEEGEKYYAVGEERERIVVGEEEVEGGGYGDDRGPKRGGGDHGQERGGGEEGHREKRPRV